MTLAIENDVFMSLVEPLRGELLAHCYRMLGSIHEAEDQVQETYLRAWRAYDRFEQRSSLRTWMYRIATNVCLTALDGRRRRPMPTGLGAPSADPHAGIEPHWEIGWLEPIPDTVLWGHPAADPAAQVVDRESVRLAFVAALQHLTPPQRAVVILRDVLAWPASDVAELLGLSVAAVNSSLQRARAQLHKLDPDTEVEPVDDERARGLLEGYVRAFEDYDIDSIVQLLAADAVWEMPPYPEWYAGARAIGSLIETQCPAKGRGDMRMVPTSANGQPAFGLYLRQVDRSYSAFQLQVLTLTDAGVAHVAAFFDVSLFDRFGLSRTLPPPVPGE